MKPFYILKILIVFISALTTIVNIVESIYIYFFNKPVFVHLYFIKKKLPKNKKAFLVKNVKFYDNLDDKYKPYFEHRLVQFFRNYDFIKKEAFEITPEMKVLIASSYVKLTFGMRRYLTSTFNKIIVYPSTYYSPITEHEHKGEFNPRLKTIVFSWEDFLLGDVITNDNINLGIHEFTHALTFHGNKSNDASARVFYEKFKHIVNYLNSNRETIIASNYFRDYAMTNNLEFMSVIMEHFFETPNELEQTFPELFYTIEKMLNYKSILNQQL